MFEMLTKVLPILLLFALGYIIREKDFIPQQGIDSVKKMIMNLALPAILFQTFLTMTLEREYLAIPILIITLLVIIFIIGKITRNIKWIGHKLNPYISSGFNFGLLGIPLFTIIFGGEYLEMFLLIGLGHEIYVWAILIPSLQMDFNNEKFTPKQLLQLVKSPILVSIFLGIFFNLLGVDRLFFENQFLKGIYGSLDYLSDMATPLILIIIGYGMQLQRKNLSQALILIAGRLLIIFGVGYAFKIMVINQMIEVSEAFNYSYLTFLLLPPMLTLPILIGLSGDNKNEELANNTAILSTGLSFIMLITLAFFSAAR